MDFLNFFFLVFARGGSNYSDNSGTYFFFRKYYLIGEDVIIHGIPQESPQANRYNWTRGVVKSVGLEGKRYVIESNNELIPFGKHNLMVKMFPTSPVNFFNVLQNLF